MRKTATLVSLLLATLFGACGGDAGLETRSFELRHLDPDQAGRILEPYIYGDRPGGGGRISLAGSVITVRETRDNLDRIARVLAEYDRPRPNVRLSFQLIEADGAGPRDTAMADVEAALRSLFRFRGYRLVAEGVAGGSEGSEVSQVLSGGGGAYRVFARILQLRSSGESTAVHLQVDLSTMPQAERLLETRVSVPVGRTAVLGNAQETGKRTLILTVRPELVRD